MAIWKQRVVAVTFSCDEHDPHVATGYRISSERVLTVWHAVRSKTCVPEVNSVLVHMPAEGEPIAAQIVWEDESLDVAVLATARPTGMASLPCFSVFVGAEDASGESCHVYGYAREHPSLAGMECSLHAGKVVGLQADRSSGQTDLVLEFQCPPDAWPGISGAPVFVSESLAGVVVSEQSGYERKRLLATPAAAFFDTAAFRSAAFRGAADDPLSSDTFLELVKKTDEYLRCKFIAEVVAQQLSLASDVRCSDLAEVVVALALSDLRDLAEALLTAAKHLQRDSKHSAALRKHPLTQVLQLAMPYSVRGSGQGGNHIDEQGCHIWRHDTATFVEASMAGREGRRAYWRRVGMHVTGRNFVMAGAAEWGIEAHQQTADLALALAERLDIPIALERGAPREDLEQALGDLNDRLKQLQRLVERDAVWEEELHTHYAIVRRAGDSRGHRNMVSDLRNTSALYPLCARNPITHPSPAPMKGTSSVRSLESWILSKVQGRKHEYA